MNKKLMIWALIILSVGFSSIYFINNILFSIDSTKLILEQPRTIPVISPIGFDFRIGSYRTALTLVESQFTQIRPDGSYSSIYPPFVSIFNIPYLILGEDNAYWLELGLLFLANIACLALVSLMIKDYVLSNFHLETFYVDIIAIFLFFSLLLYTVSSYPFLFSIERGNTDIFALLLALLAIWAFLKKPDKIWLQVILLSIATHLKIYPSVLFLPLLIKHGRKMIFPAILVNLVLFFSLGPVMAIKFLFTIISGNGIGAGVGNMWTWVGNHSAYGFADYFAINYSNYHQLLLLFWFFFTFIPLFLWGLATFRLFYKNYSSQNVVYFLMVSIPLMDLIPTVSMDYKLVILSSAALLFFGLIIKSILEKSELFDLFQLILVLVVLLFIGRPYAMSESDPYGLEETASFFVNNKYLWSLALETLMVSNIFRSITPIQRIKISSETT